MRTALALAVSMLPAFVKPTVYRLMGMKVGRGVRIGFLAVIACEVGDLGDGVSIAPLVRIRCRHLRIGARSTIGSLVKASVHTLHVGSQCTISGPNEIAGDPDDARSCLSMGPASWILPYCYVNVAREIRMGRNVGVGGGSYLFTHGLWLSRLDGYPVAFGPIELGNDVWLPWGCFLMPGVNVGDGVVVGARSVVNKSLPAGVLAAGVPAKVIRERASQPLDRAQRLEVLREVSASLAQRRGLPLDVDRQAERVVHRIGGGDVLWIHTGEAADTRQWSSRVLNVTFAEIDAASAGQWPCWSLRDYRSSSQSQLPAAGREWLTHARTAGVRYYPVDEDPIS